MSPQKRTVGGNLELSFVLPEPANAGGGPKKRLKSSSTKKKDAKSSARTKPAGSTQPQAEPKPVRPQTGPYWPEEKWHIAQWRASRNNWQKIMVNIPLEDALNVLTETGSISGSPKAQV